jgi:DNA-binding XRE family transcriptional regulator
MKELAKQVGVAESTVQSWEVNERHISMNNAKKVFDFFNVSLDHAPTIIKADKSEEEK